ncbi:unnamed protein product [Brassica napus]|uniref:Uncharacterized protein n=2 Tax=Brassica TaxID=3705 RepID=A0A3P6GYU6_BRAOL|nr:unnamed protein product [Brassica napus]VDD61425.1 unnamed protein product [Brassica oleracea]
MDSLKAKDLTETDRPSPLLLAYKGGQGRRRCFKSGINRQKDLDEMFPEWDGDVEDPAADNIIKVMFNDPGWKWTMDCWQVTGTHKVVKMEVSPVKTEIKLLGDRMGAVEKKVGITKKGSSSDDLQLTKPVHEPGSESVNGAKAGQKEAKKPSVTTEPSSSTELCLVKSTDDLPSDEPSVLILDKQVPTASDLLLEKARRQTKKETAMVNLREKSERERKLAPTQQTPFKGNSTAKQIIPNKKVDRGYDPFAPYDKKKSKELTEWLEEDPCPSRFYQVLRTPLEWLTDHQMDAFINLLRRRYQDHPQNFRSERMCFLDHIFSRQWRASYPDFKSDKGDANGLGRRLPGGAIGLLYGYRSLRGTYPEELDEPYTYENKPLEYLGAELVIVAPSL